MADKLEAALHDGENGRHEAVSARERPAGVLVRVLSREPVRARLYAFLVLLTGYLVTRGLITGNDVAFYTAAGALLLGVPAVESARARVTPSTVRG